MSADGALLVACSPGETSGRGAAYIFRGSPGQWSTPMKLSRYPSNGFCNASSVSDDGSSIFISSYLETTVYSYSYSNGSWTQTSQINANDRVSTDHFGETVSVSGDGTILAVGAPNKLITQNQAGQGSVYLFTKSSEVWTQTAKVIANDGKGGDYLGSSVAMSDDGGTLAAGADGANAVYIFSKSGGGWTQEAKLIASDAIPGDGLGMSVAVSQDGTTVVSGAYNKTVGSNASQGVIYVFKKTISGWIQAGRLSASNGDASDNLGKAIAMNSAGSVLVAGAPGRNNSKGTSYSATVSASSWSLLSEISATDGVAQDYFGGSIALSGNADLLEIGAYNKKVGSVSAAGSTYTFLVNPSISNINPSVSELSGGIPFTLSGRDIDAGAAVYFGINSAQNITLASDGTISGTVPQATSVGSVSIKVTNPNGRSDTKDSYFNYAKLPDPPTNISLTSASRQINASWSPPAYSGAQIISYTATTSGGQFCQTSATSCVINNLTNDVSYTVSVGATNWVGTGQYSAASESVTPRRYAQSIYFSNPGIRINGDTLTLTSTASSGLPIYYNSSSDLICTVDPSGFVRLISVGFCTITATQPGDLDFSSATSVTQ